MAKGSIFEKEYVDQRDKDNLEGLMEQLNLPPAFIKFVREHKRTVQIVTVVVILLVVFGSFYHSYREKRIQAASSNLASALTMEGQQKIDELNKIKSEHSRTTSALWAEIETGHALLKDGKTEEAEKEYRAARETVDESSPLYPLLTYGIAQAAEVSGKYQDASQEYKTLAAVKGYEGIGYTGQARILEEQGDKEQALKIYEEYLNDLPADISPGQKALIEEKIARIKASL